MRSNPTEENEPQLFDAEDFPEDSADGPGLGARLKREREKRGLSYVQIWEMTRLRPQVLEALEKEDWDRLPSPVFIRSFIRTYAKAIGIEEGTVLRLYERAAPPESTPLAPLKGRAKTRRRFSIFMIFPLLVLAAGYYLWKEYPFTEKGSTRPNIARLEVSQPSKSKPKQGLQKPSEPKHLSEQKKPAAVGEDFSLPLDFPLEVPAQIPEAGKKKDVLKTEQAPIASGAMDASVEPKVGTATRPSGMVLRAHIRERTWIRIFIDDQEPKEYIFSPGSLPEWSAQKGFELLIGNAGGLDLEFNGKKIMNLGDSGQVVRLNLPEDYKRPMGH
jgi:cytoskeleton protein RodZ